MTTPPSKTWQRRRRGPPITDSAIFAELLALHSVPGSVIDASWGLGKIWTRQLLEHYRPTRLDRDPDKQPDVVGDWDRLDELFDGAHFVTALWDPPFIPDAGAHGLVGGRAGGWGERYGTRGPNLRANSVVHLFKPFLQSVRRVLDPLNGTLIVKIADTVHGGPLRWQPFELRTAAIELGWLPCDYKVRQRAQPEDPKWTVQHHIRRGETFWMVFHAGDRCPSPGLPLVRVCAGATDGHLFKPRRRDQLTCGERCRKIKSRSRA